MKEVRLPGLGVIVALCGLGAFVMAFLFAPSAEGGFALVAWAMAAILLTLCVGLYLGSNVVRVVAIVFFGLFALSDIPVLVLTLIQSSNSTGALESPLGVLVGFSAKMWAAWYLTRPAVRHAFGRQGSRVGQSA